MPTERSPIDWASVRRAKPDPLAPSTPSRPLLLLYNTIATATTLVALPAVITGTIATNLISGPPRAKERPWMTMRDHVMSRVVQVVLTRFAYALPANDSGEWEIPRSARKNKSVHIQKVTLQPSQTERIGFAVCDGVEAVTRPAFILSPADAPAKGWDRALEGEKAVLYFHGGAYAFGHAVERPFAANMSKEFGVRILAVNYRKVLNNAQAFPAPLLDALAGWEYLVNNMGFDPANITLSGESAGANLSLLLARYLADLGVPGPGALALSSPWCDMSPKGVHRPSMLSNYYTDYLPFFKKPSPAAAAHYTPEARVTPYFSPVYAKDAQWHHLHGVRVYVQAGQGEILIDEIRETVRNMREGGVEVAYVEEPGGVHVAPALSDVFKGSEAWKQWVEDVGPLVKGQTGDVKGWPRVRESWAEVNKKDL